MRFKDDSPSMIYDVSGVGEPLVLLPGGLTGWISWIPHAEALSESRQVIRLQLHSVALGLSNTPVPNDYSVNYEIAALQKALDVLAIEQADFAGWSYGGTIAFSFALHNPHRIRSLTLIEPGAFWMLRSQGAYELSEQALVEQRFFHEIAHTDDVSDEQLVKFLHIAGILPEDEDPRTLPGWPIWHKHRQSLRTGHFEAEHEDTIDQVRTFEKPVLLVKGEGSSPELHDIIDLLADELPNARAITLPGGHGAHIVSMPLFLERYTRFLSELS
jgi:pimeloyl-ACP methyl ester carboxylesterase